MLYRHVDIHDQAAHFSSDQLAASRRRRHISAKMRHYAARHITVPPQYKARRYSITLRYACDIFPLIMLLRR